MKSCQSLNSIIGGIVVRKIFDYYNMTFCKFFLFTTIALALFSMPSSGVKPVCKIIKNTLLILVIIFFSFFQIILYKYFLFIIQFSASTLYEYIFICFRNRPLDVYIHVRMNLYSKSGETCTQ